MVPRYTPTGTHKTKPTTVRKTNIFTGSFIIRNSIKYEIALAREKAAVAVRTGADVDSHKCAMIEASTIASTTYSAILSRDKPVFEKGLPFVFLNSITNPNGIDTIVSAIKITTPYARTTRKFIRNTSGKINIEAANLRMNVRFRQYLQLTAIGRKPATNYIREAYNRIVYPRLNPTANSAPAQVQIPPARQRFSRPPYRPRATRDRS